VGLKEAFSSERTLTPGANIKVSRQQTRAHASEGGKLFLDDRGEVRKGAEDRKACSYDRASSQGHEGADERALRFHYYRACNT